MSTKKSSSAKASKKVAARPAATHPSWIDMIKECIAASPDESRQGVSRPHIKKFVEEQYNLQIGNAQNTQLSRAIASGADKGIFVLPKGPAGKVKLSPRNVRPVDTSASKENKPAKASAPKSAPKARPAKASPLKAGPVKAIAAKRVAARTKVATSRATAAKKVVEKKAEAAKSARTTAVKAVAAKAPKKVLAGKKAATAKKATAPSKRGAAKRAVTGVSSPAKAIARKAPSSRKPPAVRKSLSKRLSARLST